MSFGGRTNPFPVHIRQSPINHGVVGDETTYLRESSIRMGDYSMGILTIHILGSEPTRTRKGFERCWTGALKIWRNLVDIMISLGNFGYQQFLLGNCSWISVGSVGYFVAGFNILLDISWISVGRIVYTRCSPVFLSTRTTGSMFEKLPQLRSLANTFQVYKMYTGKTYRLGEKDQGRLQCDAHGGAHRRTMADLVTCDVILKGHWDTFYPPVMSK